MFLRTMPHPSLRRALTGLLAVAALALPAGAAPVGDDGLHKPDWLRETFLDLREDLAEATAEGKRLMVLVEQRGCIYCKRMHEEVFPDPAVDAAIREDFFVVQINMFGDVEVVDLDGTALPEKEMVRRWGLLFTPTLMFLPEEPGDAASAAEASVATMPGAFGKHTTLNLLTYVSDKVYETDEPFQKYHARRLQEEGIIE
ncbi:thioredoxin family protein [Roseivivax isoporae]|uniref:Thioredoxin n=1 Tax=Roseivivax isoporae LMG 25204 TaxID=1449351 RepID=X7F582_9RHOB|nr:thioredoxin family protein [Roseivivax isoporae]ETX27256.1 thioredoxin [Roseivivax isoporae LMG 25204]